MTRRLIAWLVLAAGVVLMARAARGQSSSLAGGSAHVRTVRPVPAEPPEAPGPGFFHRNAALEQTSFVAVVLPPPRNFRVHDLITVVVQERKQYESDGRTRTKNEVDLRAKLQDWFRFYEDHRLGTDQLSNGQPGVDLTFEAERKARGDHDREDKLTTRVQVEIVDVKPNGVLVFEASKHISHDEEDIRLTLTGKCRGDDVGPDNSVLSTKVADLEVLVHHRGITKSATERGWLTKAWDLVKPI